MTVYWSRIRVPSSHLLKADRWPQLSSTIAGSRGLLVQNHQGLIYQISKYYQHSDHRIGFHPSALSDHRIGFHPSALPYHRIGFHPSAVSDHQTECQLLNCQIYRAGSLTQTFPGDSPEILCESVADLADFFSSL